MSEKYLLYLVGLIIIFIMFKVSAKLLKFLLILTMGFLFFTLLNGCSTGNLNPSSSINDAEENTLTRIQDMPFVT